jgi:phage-related protein
MGFFSFVSKAWDGLKSLPSKAWDAVKNGASDAWSTVKHAAGSVSDVLKSGAKAVVKAVPIVYCKAKNVAKTLYNDAMTLCTNLSKY